MASKDEERKCFTFLWKLENISYCLQKKGEMIRSPAFVVDAINKTAWRLGIFPRGETNGNFVSFFLYKELGIDDDDNVEINYELSFLSKDESALQSRTIPKTRLINFRKVGRGYIKFVPRRDVFITRRSAFLPQDILTARCRIWKTVGEFDEDVRCTAHTRIGVVNRIFQWNVKNFSAREPEKICRYEIKSTENDSTIMSVDLTLTGGLSAEEIIRFELLLNDLSIKFSTLKLSLIDGSGNKIACNQDEFWFDELNKSEKFTFFFTKNKLMANKSNYLPEDILSLLWEWSFSEGIVLEKTVAAYHGCTNTKSKICDLQEVNGEELVPISDVLNENLKSLYESQFLCDVELNTSTSTFPAHKIILSSASSVFKAMFSNDMKEKNSDCVNIEDLSDDAVRRMLMYIYSSKVECETSESASHLYVAADKYAIQSLKNICSSYLKRNLSPINACEVLLLSDFHADCDLKSVVQDYILKHDKDVINSDEWKHLMDTNTKLAAETLCLRYK